MSVKQFYHDIDLVKVGQLVDARFKNVTNQERSDLALTLGAGNVGLVVYDTDDSEMYVWNGSAFSKVSSDVSGDIVFRGVINPTNADTGDVSAVSGNQYVVDAAGTLTKTDVTFSPSGVVEVGDIVLFTSATEATVLQRNVEDATTSKKGIVELATAAETDAGTSTTTAVTPASLTNVLGDISTNASNISTNTANITTNTSNIATNTSNISTNTTAIGTLASLETDVKTDLVSAINEVNTNADNNASAISTNTSNISTNTTAIGTLTSLTTDIKTDLVSAINEVDANADANASAIATNTSNISTNTNNIATNTGNISTNASNIATNASNIATNTSDIGTLTNLTTDEKGSLVGAINEHETQINDLTSRDNVKVYTNAAFNVSAGTAFRINHDLNLSDKDFFTIRVCDSAGSSVSVDVDSVDANNVDITSLVSLTGLKCIIIGL